VRSSSGSLGVSGIRSRHDVEVHASATVHAHARRARPRPRVDPARCLHADLLLPGLAVHGRSEADALQLIEPKGLDAAGRRARRRNAVARGCERRARSWELEVLLRSSHRLCRPDVVLAQRMISEGAHHGRAVSLLARALRSPDIACRRRHSRRGASLAGGVSQSMRLAAARRRKSHCPWPLPRMGRCLGVEGRRRWRSCAAASWRTRQIMARR
jgi:hypothetical protein